MIEFETACKTAYDYYEKEWGTKGLLEAKDLGNAWLFDGGEPDEILYGMHSIAINKETGEYELFILPDEKNFELLRQAKETEIPKEYRYRAS